MFVPVFPTFYIIKNAVFSLEVGSIPLSMDFMENGIHSKKIIDFPHGMESTCVGITTTIIAWLM